MIDHNANDEEAAEQLMRYRVKALPWLTLLTVIAVFGALFSEWGDEKRDIIILCMLGFVFYNQYTFMKNDSSFFTTRPNIGDFLQDELTRSHQLQAVVAAAWTMFVVGWICMLSPKMLDLQALHAGIAVTGAGSIAASIRFWQLERRALMQ